MQQECTLYFQRNLNKHIRKTDRVNFCNEIKEVFNPDEPFYTPSEASNKLKEVLKNWSKKYPQLKRTIERDDLETIFTYLMFDYRIRKMIYTTNWIERLNKSFRRTLKMRNALPLTLLGFTAMEMEEGTYSYPITNFKFDKKFSYN